VNVKRLKSDIYLSLSVWHSTSITNFPRENLLSAAFSLTILSLTVLILRELFTLCLSSTLSFGAVATLEFTSLSGAPVTIRKRVPSGKVLPWVEGGGEDEAQPFQAGLWIEELIFQLNREGARRLIAPGGPPVDPFSFWNREGDVDRRSLPFEP